MSNYKLIMLDNPILTADKKEILPGEKYYYLHQNNEIRLSIPSDKDYFKILNKFDKIIATNNSEYNDELPSIDFSKLSKKEKTIIEWVDIEDLAWKHTRKTGSAAGFYDFISGFELAKKLYSKKLNLEDTELLISEIIAKYKLGKLNDLIDVNKIIKSYFNSVKKFDVEISCKCSMCGGKNYHKLSCKTPSLRDEKPIVKNNSIKINKII